MASLAQLPPGRYEDPLTRIDWNAIDTDCWWLPPDALSLAGVPEFEALPASVRRRVSHVEYAHLLQAGLWLESVFMHAVKPGGCVIVATFGPEGPSRCSGLDVARYGADALHDEFGPRFRLLNHLTEIHKTPAGTTQQFTYCYCKVRSRKETQAVRQ